MQLIPFSCRALSSFGFFFCPMLFFFATFWVARLTFQTRKLWLVGVATDRAARHACLRFFSFQFFPFFCLRFFSFCFPSFLGSTKKRKKKKKKKASREVPPETPPKMISYNKCVIVVKQAVFLVGSVRGQKENLNTGPQSRTPPFRRLACLFAEISLTHLTKFLAMCSRAWTLLASLSGSPGPRESLTCSI